MVFYYVIIFSYACGLQVDVEEAEGLRAYLDIDLHEFIVGVGEVVVFGVFQRIATEDDQVEDFVFTGVLDIVGIVTECYADAVPMHDVGVGTFLHADDIGILLFYQSCCGCQVAVVLEATTEEVDIPRD